MSDYNTLTRSQKYYKRRKNNRKIIFFMILAVIFFIILFILIFTGNNEEGKEDTSNVGNKIEDSLVQDEDKDKIPDTNLESKDLNGEMNKETNDNEVDNGIIQKIESDDENVIEAFTGDWPPIGTVQTGPHTTNYNDGSDDRIEIKRAVSKVTNIEEDEMIEWRVENGGDQKVIATVSNKDQSTYYRIYLSWIDGQGWKVTKGERIKEYRP